MEGQRKLEWRNAPPQADHPRLTGDGPDHRVIGRTNDGAIVMQEGIGHML